MKSWRSKTKCKQGVGCNASCVECEARRQMGDELSFAASTNCLVRTIDKRRHAWIHFSWANHQKEGKFFVTLFLVHVQIWRKNSMNWMHATSHSWSCQTDNIIHSLRLCDWLFFFGELTQCTTRQKKCHFVNAPLQSCSSVWWNVRRFDQIVACPQSRQWLLQCAHACQPGPWHWTCRSNCPIQFLCLTLALHWTFCQWMIMTSCPT